MFQCRAAVDIRVVLDEKQNLLPKIKQNVEDVQAILQENMERANDRYENLDELDERADKLLAYSTLFERTMRNHTENPCQENRRCWGEVFFCVIFWFCIAVIMSIVIIGTQKHWF
ncbi:vesicle-associated membrane protein 2-like isoform X3 [Tachysurus ichikawai]